MQSLACHRRGTVADGNQKNDKKAFMNPMKSENGFGLDAIAVEPVRALVSVPAPITNSAPP